MIIGVPLFLFASPQGESSHDCLPKFAITYNVDSDLDFVAMIRSALLSVADLTIELVSRLSWPRFHSSRFSRAILRVTAGKTPKEMFLRLPPKR
jgi:hypothetical protein